jgi:plastocyanin
MKLKTSFNIAWLAAAFFLFGVYQNASAASFAVNVGQAGNNFVPANLTLTQGDAVNWNWVGGTHNITSGSCPGGSCTADGKFNSGAATATLGNNFSFTFNNPGTYPYFCSIHLAQMQGTIAVNARPPAEVPEADSLLLLLSGGAGLASFLALKWRGRQRVA